MGKSISFKKLLAGLFLGSLLLYINCQRASAQPAIKDADLANRLAHLAGPKDAVAVAGPDGTMLAAVHPDLLLVPASILKVLTSLAALHYLGADYRYPTDFFLDADQNLKIKGYGNPLLVSERLRAMASQMSQAVGTIQNLIVDGTYFDTPLVIPGRQHSTEPYDAPNGALCVNFNTVFFLRRDGQWVSAEEQTPLLPWVIPKIEASGLTNGRITLAGTTDEGLIYTGELFRYFLEQAGVMVHGHILRAAVDPRSDKLLQRCWSEEQLTDVISNLMEFSNNFIANQLMLTMGAHVYGPPANVDKGIRALRQYYSQVLGITEGHIVEASGISRQNQVSVRIMLRLLSQFKGLHYLMRSKEGRHWYKTGHLDGIRTQAGYLLGRDEKLFTYVVMINSPGKTTHRMLSVIESAVK